MICNPVGVGGKDAHVTEILPHGETTMFVPPTGVIADLSHNVYDPAIWSADNNVVHGITVVVTLELAITPVTTGIVLLEPN